MDNRDIQKRIDALAAAMSAKGLREPEAHAEIRSAQEGQVYLNWVKFGSTRAYADREYRFFKGETFTAMLDEADAEVAALPSLDETKHRDFMTALGNVIDLGRQHGIDVAYVNPLVESMKRLSENVLTFQKDAAE